ncbi:hypothetical protein [Hyphomicrobium sp.]|uniref:hypothetical protein n=1 Tax=Hyphomicrobium sp. TaxID=82 RepID=UPI001E0AE303|nr:hypothetical protein [Hyphomicrobium sp.]MBY0559926.1 hypothetical protein [Hyphomicrobium sp.]
MKVQIPSGEYEIEVDGYYVDHWEVGAERDTIGIKTYWWRGWRPRLTPWRKFLKIKVSPIEAPPLPDRIALQNEIEARFAAAREIGITHDEYLKRCTAALADIAATFLAKVKQ